MQRNRLSKKKQKNLKLVFNKYILKVKKKFIQNGSIYFALKFSIHQKVICGSTTYYY